MPLPNTSPARRSGRPAPKSAPHAAVSASWSFASAGNLRILQLNAFKQFPWLLHGFSTRPGGVSSLGDEKALNLGFVEWDARENVLKNRSLFQSALGAADLPLITLKQCHSDIIHHVASAPHDSPSHGDASLTETPGLLLAIQTADCVPILLVDPKRRATAAIHAGWRGTLARIAEKAVGRMRMQFNSNPSHLLAALGPSIGPCCYEVGPELVTRFTSQFGEAADWFDEPRTGEEPNPLQWMNMAPPGHQPPPKNVHLDLRKALRSQLLAAGLRNQNILVSDLCTACRPDLFFSYRKQASLSGRLLSAIALRPV